MSSGVRFYTILAKECRLLLAAEDKGDAVVGVMQCRLYFPLVVVLPLKDKLVRLIGYQIGVY